MKAKTLAAKQSTLTANSNNLKCCIPRVVCRAAELRGGDKLKHVVVAIGKRKLIISERVTEEDLSQEHEELLELLKN